MILEVAPKDLLSNRVLKVFLSSRELHVSRFQVGAKKRWPEEKYKKDSPPPPSSGFLMDVARMDMQPWIMYDRAQPNKTKWWDALTACLKTGALGKVQRNIQNKKEGHDHGAYIDRQLEKGIKNLM